MNISQLKQTAREKLSRGEYPPHRLALWYAGLAVGITLAITVINYLLTQKMDAAAGLAGIGTRTTLSFVQTLLMLGSAVAMPFWDLGFTHGSLCIARGEYAGPDRLLEGFRRFGVSLRLLLIRSALLVAVGFACLQLAAFLFMMSPWSMNTLALVEELTASGTLEMTDEAITKVLSTIWPAYVLFGILILVLLLPTYYRFRLADWAIMDDQSKALRAMKLSTFWTFRRRFWLFRLDLSFWWFYGLQALASALTYGDVLLEALGVTISQTVLFWTCCALSAVAQILIAWRFAPQVHTTYALAYDALRAEKKLRIEN